MFRRGFWSHRYHQEYLGHCSSDGSYKTAPALANTSQVCTPKGNHYFHTTLRLSVAWPPSRRQQQHAMTQCPVLTPNATPITCRIAGSPSIVLCCQEPCSPFSLAIAKNRPGVWSAAVCRQHSAVAGCMSPAAATESWRSRGRRPPTSGIGGDIGGGRGAGDWPSPPSVSRVIAGPDTRPHAMTACRRSQPGATGRRRDKGGGSCPGRPVAD